MTVKRKPGPPDALARSWQGALRRDIPAGRWSWVCSSLLAYLSLGNLVGLARSNERRLRARPQPLAVLSHSKDTMSWVRCLRCGAQAGEGGAQGRGQEQLCHSRPCGAAELGAADPQGWRRVLSAQDGLLRPVSKAYYLLSSFALPSEVPDSTSQG